MTTSVGSVPPPGPLSYTGSTFVQFIMKRFPPQDTFNTFQLGTIWLDTENQIAYVLVSKELGIAQWVVLGGAPGDLNTITTPDSVVVVPDAGNINFLNGTGMNITGSMDNITFNVTNDIATTYTSNSGIAVPVANNLNVFGTNNSLNGYSPWVTGSGDTLTVNMPGTVKWVINPTPGLGTHTTFAGAIASASANDIIFVTGGVYEEDPVINKNLTFTCFAGTERYVNTDVVLLGKTTINGGASATYQGINCRTNGDSLLVHDGNGAVFTFDQCDLSVEAGVTGIIQDTGDSTNNTFLTQSYALIAPTGKLFDIISGGVIWFDYTDVEGLDSVASTVTGGGFSGRFCSFITPISSPMSGGQIILQYCQFGTINSPFQNVTWITNDSTDPAANAVAYYCRFSSGTASCVSTGAGATTQLYNCNFNSSNTNAITGAGTLIYSNLTFLNSHLINNATQTTTYTNLGKYQASGQPAFGAGTVDVANVTGDGTIYQLLWTNVNFDQNNNFAGGVFTAPVSGRYQFSLSVGLTLPTGAFTEGNMRIVADGNTYFLDAFNPSPIRIVGTNGLVVYKGSLLISMTAGSTAVAQIQIGGSTQTVGIAGAQCFFSGFLAC